MKVKLITNPGVLVLCDFLSQVLVLSYVLRIFERPFTPDSDDPDNKTPSKLDYYENSIWLITMTLTTVGYGDLHPRTRLGRLVAVVTAMWGAILISLIVVSTV